jgi:ApaG protein
MKHSLASETVTNGIRITAQAYYLPERSNNERSQHVFGYHIVITNDSQTGVRLLSRHWVIIDANGVREDIQGPGVVGKTPRLEPGESFAYDSFCPLATEWGTMEGTYQMQTDNGHVFDAAIGRFYLVAPSLKPTELAH